MWRAGPGNGRPCSAGPQRGPRPNCGRRSISGAGGGGLLSRRNKRHRCGFGPASLAAPLMGSRGGVKGDPASRSVPVLEPAAGRHRMMPILVIPSFPARAARQAPQFVGIHGETVFAVWPAFHFVWTSGNLGGSALRRGLPSQAYRRSLLGKAFYGWWEARLCQVRVRRAAAWADRALLRRFAPLLFHFCFALSSLAPPLAEVPPTGCLI